MIMSVSIPHIAPHTIIGDMNEDLLTRPSQTPITDFLTANGFAQMADGPTTNYGSLLDHAFTKHIML